MQMRRGAISKREGHSRRVVRFRLDQPGGAEGRYVAGGYLPGRAGSVSRMVSELAAGGDGHARARSLQTGDYAWLDAGRGGPADVEIGGQWRIAERNLREMGRRSAAIVGDLAGLSVGRAVFTGNDEAARGILPENSQHFSFCAGEFGQ